MHFGTEGQHPRWIEPATALPHKGAMAAVKMSPEPQRLPGHAPSFSRTQHPGSPLVQAAGYHPFPWPTAENGLLSSFPKAFPLHPSAEAVLFSLPPHPS